MYQVLVSGSNIRPDGTEVFDTADAYADTLSEAKRIAEKFLRERNTLHDAEVYRESTDTIWIKHRGNSWERIAN